MKGGSRVGKTNDEKDEVKESENKTNERAAEARIVRRIVSVIFTIFAIGLVGLGIGLYIYVTSALQPAAPENETVIDVSIPIGSSGRTIASILEENGIISDARIFRYYIKFRNESGFQAGDYKLSPSMEIPEIIESLKTGKIMKEALLTITIPEGKQLEEIATIVDKKTSHSSEDFLSIANDPDYLDKLIGLYPSILSDEILDENIRYPLEGYLFPATYDFYETNPSVESIIETMLNQTEIIILTYQDQIEAKDFSIHELITMASLIEEEATEKADRQKISSVFFNRLDVNMPLQTDPTVLYSLGRHSVQITYDDLKVESPYNTYFIKGLPIGPISNAGETSIQAALNPADTDSLYFYARPSGEVIFTASLKEHNTVKNKYKHEWDEYKN